VLTLQSGEADEARAWRLRAYTALYAAVESVLRLVFGSLALTAKASVLCATCEEFRTGTICGVCDANLASIKAWLPRVGDALKPQRDDWGVVSVAPNAQSVLLAAAVERLVAHESALRQTTRELLALNECGLAFADDLAKLHTALLDGGEALSEAQKRAVQRVCAAASELYDALVQCEVPAAWDVGCDARGSQVFFSYSGDDGRDYARDTFAALQEALRGRGLVFLDKNLEVGEAFTKAAVRTLLTCRMVFAVVSRRFVTRNKWPLHELAVACARVRRAQTTGAHDFTIVHDAYSAGEDHAWVASLVKLPVRWLYADGEIEQVCVYDEKTMVAHREATVQCAVRSLTSKPSVQADRKRSEAPSTLAAATTDASEDHLPKRWRQAAVANESKE